MTTMEEQQNDLQSGSEPERFELQIAVGRTESGAPYVAFRSRDYVMVYPGHLVAQTMLGEYEAAERNMAMALFGPGDVVIEAGVGIGATTVEIARQGAAVWGLDGLRDVLEFAMMNVEANGLEERVNLLHGVLGSSDGGLEFNRRSTFITSSALEDGMYPSQGDTVETFVVPCISLDRIVQEKGANGLHMDIEGHEYQVVTESDLGPLNKVSLEYHPQILGVERCWEIHATLEAAGLFCIGIAGWPNYPNQAYVMAYCREDVLPEGQEFVTMPHPSVAHAD